MSQPRLAATDRLWSWASLSHPRAFRFILADGEGAHHRGQAVNGMTRCGTELQDRPAEESGKETALTEASDEAWGGPQPRRSAGDTKGQTTTLPSSGLGTAITAWHLVLPG